MKRRNLLVVIALAILLVCASFTPTSSAGRSCLSECWDNYNLCKSNCVNDPECLTQCWDNYQCCRAFCLGTHCTR